MASPDAPPITEGRIIGRYALYGEIAAGGMAAVHLGRLVGLAGFSRTVAVKRLHAQYANDPEFVSMFLDEARLAARIQHPNVVSTLDIVALDGEVFLVMEYVQGAAAPPTTVLVPRCAAEPRVQSTHPLDGIAVLAGRALDALTTAA